MHFTTITTQQTRQPDIMQSFYMQAILLIRHLGILYWLSIWFLPRLHSSEVPPTEASLIYLSPSVSVYRMRRTPFPLCLQELSGEPSSAFLSEVDGTIDGSGALSVSPLCFQRHYFSLSPSSAAHWRTYASSSRHNVNALLLLRYHNYALSGFHVFVCNFSCRLYS